MTGNEPLNAEALGFSVFCIENLAMRLNVDSARVYEALAQKSDILDAYIIPCWDVLHTQGKNYIMDDLEALMRERGITI